MTKDSFKVLVWVAVVGFWVGCAVFFAAFKEQYPAAWMCVGLGITSLFAVGAILKAYFGLRRHAAKHLGIGMGDATFVTKEVSAGRIADYRNLLEYFCKSHSGSKRWGGSFSEYMSDLSALGSDNIERTTIQWTTRQTPDGEIEQFSTNAVYMLVIDGKPIVASILASFTSSEFHELETVSTGEGSMLQVYARSIEDAKVVLKTIVSRASEHSVYRGQLIQVSTGSVRIADRPTIDDARIVLPPEILETVNRMVSARSKHHDLLSQLGHSSKTGILLHGPPGTGKTLVAKHLVGHCDGHTGIVPADLETPTLRECFRMAAYLQPAIIVIEDVDLLAKRREENSNVSGLQQLMNEMDGLAPTCETIVLMSTNLPEVIEPALINRPGRVSQAIYFPLPDANYRKRLFELYCPMLADSEIQMEKLIEKTEGASPAFIEELSKRAILFSAEREVPNVEADGNVTIQINSNDIDQALHELVVLGGVLTKGILGFSGGSELE